MTECYPFTACGVEGAPSAVFGHWHLSEEARRRAFASRSESKCPNNKDIGTLQYTYYRNHMVTDDCIAVRFDTAIPNRNR